MALSGLSRDGVRNALYDLEQLGIANNDTTLTAYLHEGIERSSQRRLESAVGLEQALVDRMRELAPDLDAEARASVLHLRPVTQALKDDGHEGALPLLVLLVVPDGGAASLGLHLRMKLDLHAAVRVRSRSAPEPSPREPCEPVRQPGPGTFSRVPAHAAATSTRILLGDQRAVCETVSIQSSHPGSSAGRRSGARS